MRKTQLSIFIVTLAILPWNLSCAPPPAGADLILQGGKIITLNDDQPQVQALAIADGKILALGSTDSIGQFRGSNTEVIDLDGRLVIPGFIEGHGHFTGIGRSLQKLDLRENRSWTEIVDQVVIAAADVEPGQWIVGWGWHQEKWDRTPEVTVEGYPVNDELSRRLPDHPVLLKHAAGSHAGIANAMALQLAGVGLDTPDPVGGKILRHADGRPTGVLRENAYGIVLAAQVAAEENDDPQVVRQMRRREATLAAEECIRHGITGFHDAGMSFSTLDVIREMAEAGELPMRLWVMLEESNQQLAEHGADYRWDWVADGHLTVGGIKRYMDGALGSHGAWLLEPYLDLPETAGQNTSPIASIEQTARIAIELGFQLCIHAIGDRANRETLDLFERVIAEYPDSHDLRWRIEHAQHLHPDDIPRFAELGVIASMQGVHCTSDAPWVPIRIGPERAQSGAYVWRSLMEAGALVINGTDAPVENVDPLANFYSAVSRRPRGHEPFYPYQAMTRMEALRAATSGPAYAAHQEHRVGSLKVGLAADLVVLSEDLLEIEEARIPEVRVQLTMVGGEVRFRSEAP